MMTKAISETNKWISSHPKTCFALGAGLATAIAMSVLLKFGILQKAFKPMGNFFNKLNTLCNNHPNYVMGAAGISTAAFAALFLLFKNRSDEKQQLYFSVHRY